MNSNLHHLYVSPLEACNLRCQMCYTTKTPSRLTNLDVLDFVSRYRQHVDLQTITFCGGEVFLLTDFPDLINTLTQQGQFIQIITNGTLNRLSQLHHPNAINLIVSLDGLPAYHDKNRGVGNWQHSIDFMRQAQQLGFHLEVFSIVTQENFNQIDQFESFLQHELGRRLDVTYHPRKPLTYLHAHPISNQSGTTQGFSFLTPQQHLALSQRRHIFPPPHLGCYQLSLMSDGRVYGCCEGIRPLGSIKSDISELITKFENQLDPQLNCVEPAFVCGLKQIYAAKSLITNH